MMRKIRSTFDIWVGWLFFCVAQTPCENTKIKAQMNIDMCTMLIQTSILSIEIYVWLAPEEMEYFRRFAFRNE